MRLAEAGQVALTYRPEHDLLSSQHDDPSLKERVRR
jgi:hypothetical protein